MFKKKKFVPFLRIILLLLFIVTAVFLFLGLNVEKVQAQYPYSVNCYWDFYKDVYLCASGSGTCYAPCNWCGGVGAYYGHADQLICQNTATGAISYPGSQHCHNGGWDHPSGYSLCYYISSWTCSGSTPVASGTGVVGGNSCSNAPMPSCIVNGQCGIANNKSFAAAPASGRCSAGSSTAISGDGSAASPWTWTCNGSGGGSNSLACKAFKLPTVDLTATPTSIYSGQPSSLSWTTTNAVSCNATSVPAGWSGSKSVSGPPDTVFPTANTTYTLGCLNSVGGLASDSATVTILPGPTVSLTPPLQIKNPGNSATISWTSARAVACEATDPPGWTSQTGTSGSETFIPTHTGDNTGDKVYKMKSKNSAGIYSPEASARVCVRNNDCSSANTVCQGTSFTVPNGCDLTTCVGTKLPGCTGWSDCSPSCGGGTQTETGCDCGAVPRTRACNTQPCPPGYKEVTPW